MNIVSTWLFLIGTKTNAARLRARLSGLKSPPLDPSFGVEPLQCPLTVLYGAEVSRQAYANPALRPALDAWDTGMVTPDDLRRWCLVIEGTDGPVEYVHRFNPMLNASAVRQKAYAYASLQREAEREAYQQRREKWISEQ